MLAQALYEGEQLVFSEYIITKHTTFVVVVVAAVVVKCEKLLQSSRICQQNVCVLAKVYRFIIFANRKLNSSLGLNKWAEMEKYK